MKYFLLVFMFFVSSVKAQIKEYRLQDVKDESIPFASVLLSELSGTSCDIDGNFTIDFSVDFNEVTIESLGYETKIISKKDLLLIDSVIILKEDKNQLDTVYLSNKKIDVEYILKKTSENLYSNHHLDSLYFKEEMINIDKIYPKDAELKVVQHLGWFRSNKFKLDLKENLPKRLNVISQKENIFNVSKTDSSFVNLKETTYHNIDTTKLYDTVSDKIFDDKFYDRYVENTLIIGSLGLIRLQMAAQEKPTLDSFEDSFGGFEEEEGDKNYEEDNSTEGLIEERFDVKNTFILLNSYISTKYAQKFEEEITNDNGRFYVVSFEDYDKDGKLYINVNNFGIQKISVKYKNKGQGASNFLFSMFGFGFKTQDNLELIEFKVNNGKYIPDYQSNSVLINVKIKPNIAIKNMKTRKKTEFDPKFRISIVTDNLKTFSLINKSEFDVMKSNPEVNEQRFLPTDEIEKMIHDLKSI